MDARVYRRNRAAIPNEDLSSYAGQWVAFAADGTYVAAAHEDFEVLHNLVVAAGLDPAEVGYERIDPAEDWQGGLEFE